MTDLDPEAARFSPSEIQNEYEADPMAGGAYQGIPPVPVSAHLNHVPGFQESDFRGQPIDGYRFQVIKLETASDCSSRIYVVFDIHRQRECALKAISDYNRRLNTFWPHPEQQTRIRHEVTMHSRVKNHRNVCTLVATLQYAPVGHLVMDLCRMDMRALIESSRKGTVQLNIRKLFLDIVNGVMYCHQQNVAHRNLNPRNIGIIFDEQYREDYAVLLDFGESISPLQSSDLISLELNGYAAPEMHQTRVVASAVHNWAAADIWSLGVILFYMCTAQKPFDDHIHLTQRLYDHYKQGAPLRSRFPQISEELEAILRNTFTRNPSRRPSLRKLKLAILNCENFFSPDHRSYPHLTGTPSRRDQALLENQRLDQRDDVHDDFYGGLLDYPPALPAPSAHPDQMKQPDQPSRTPRPVQPSRDFRSIPPVPAEAGAPQLPPDRVRVALQRSMARAAAHRAASAQEMADRSLENRRSQIVASQIMAPQTMAPQTMVPRTMNSQTMNSQTMNPHTMAPQTMVSQTMAGHTISAQSLAARTRNPQAQIRPQNIPTWAMTPWNYGQTLPAQPVWRSYLPMDIPTQNTFTQNIMNMPPGNPNQPSPPRTPWQPQQRGRLGLSIPMPTSSILVQTTSAPNTPGQILPPRNMAPEHLRAQSTPAQNIPASNTFGTFGTNGPFNFDLQLPQGHSHLPRFPERRGLRAPPHPDHPPHPPFR
ncbi:kinase-like domain-containing protein [Cadophora sp. MPI-SDFR-AT-0126]|nr:kinase-like domain-containing protein [Leotiomycetes sp. MPI-SDFR-AT-0126]